MTMFGKLRIRNQERRQRATLAQIMAVIDSGNATLKHAHAVYAGDVYYAAVGTEQYVVLLTEWADGEMVMNAWPYDPADVKSFTEAHNAAYLKLEALAFDEVIS